MTEMSPPGKVLVLGAGPAGLMAAWELNRQGIDVTVIEGAKDAGGQGGTTLFKGRDGDYRFDYGGHRFITHNRSLLELVEELVGDDLLTSMRKSVIRLKGREYAYPLSLSNLLKNAPVSMLTGAFADLAAMPFQSGKSEDNFADWIINRFGRTLYVNFFEGYTAKLWGLDPRNLSADWAAQRISLVDLKEVARLLLPLNNDTPRTYSRVYRYPKYGFGMIFSRLAERLQKSGVHIFYGHKVDTLLTEGNRVRAVQCGGETLTADAVISTLPLPLMARMTGLETSLQFRGLRFFNMMMDMADVSPCTWQYLSDPDILATRLQEPRRRSPYMSPPGKTSLMLEIPCDPGSRLWSLPDRQLFDLVCRDLVSLGIGTGKATGEFFSARAAHAYPLMRVGYEKERARALDHLSSFRNLIPCGRQGTFRYIFTDTAMEMGQMAAQCLLSGRDRRKEIYNHRNEKTVIELQNVA